MSTVTANDQFRCEQCGTPLVVSGTARRCLHCLLQSGIQPSSFSQASNQERYTYEHYEILRREDGSLWELGRNSVSVTYKARDTNLDMLVALKVLNPDLSSQPEARADFLRQAQAMAQIRHPNVVNIIQFGRTTKRRQTPNQQTEDWFYAMEFVEGETLATRVSREGPLSFQMATKIALDISFALAAAERLGVVQYEITPSRIVLDTWVETNFARAGAEFETQLSARIINLGLPDTTAPTTRPAFDAGNARRGIYSLGVTLLFSLIGDSAGSVISRGKLPVRQLKARRVPKGLIALLKSMLSLNSRSKAVPVSQCVHALQECFSEIRNQTNSEHRTRCRVTVTVFASLTALGLCLLGLTLQLPLVQKSITVLPFRNLSNNPTDSCFAAELVGVIYKALRNDYQVKLLNELNTLIYSADSINDFNAVRRGLGGQFLLEGYIRREKDELLLHLLLVDAQSSQQVWARKYQFEPTQSLRIKAKVASDVVAALKSKFSSDQRTNLSFESTKNPDAYALYLQGRQLERNPASSVSSYENAESFYRQAVALDPEYALAHARLAIMAGALYRFRSSSKELQMLSLSEAKKALRLAPSLAEAHLAMALYYYRVERNFDSALSELSTAQRCFPNDGEVEATRAYVYRRQARWHEALLEQYDALARDPINQDYERELQVTACLLRDWHRAADHAARAVALSPKLPHLLGERALISYWSDGNLKPLRNFFQALVGFGDEEGNLTWSQWDAALLSREFTSAELALQNFPRDTLPSVGSGPIPKTYLQGCSYLAQGDQPRANIFFQRAKPFFEAEIAGHPNDAMRHARLGLLYAYMGRKEDAIREGTRATEITPVWEDAVEGHQWLCNLALIHARVGNSDEAIQMIESLLREPGCVSPLNEACMTLWDLRLRWQWDPLRKDPRFQKILNDPEPATAY